MEDGSTHAVLGLPVKGLSTAQTLIVAASAGLSVANVYYAQPLLDIMALDFGMSSAATGSIVTLTQIGYGLGLILIVPIGDLFDRRFLIVAQGILSAIALMVVATARTQTILFSGMAAMGLLAVIAQVLVGYAAALATVAQRGKVIGTVTSGIVMGILAARSIAGSVADLGGWRAVYMLSATLTLFMVCLLLRALPSQHPEQRSETYISAVSSVPIMILREPVLLIRGILALLIFAAFSTFWTALVLPLTNRPFSYSHTQVGLFGLVGLAGAVASTYAGKLADRGHAYWTTGISLLLLLISWGWIAFLPVSIPILLIGVVLLDLAVQAVHVTSLSIIVAFHLQKSGRLIGGYMVFYSVGSAVGAIATTTIYARFGWPGVSALGATFSIGALVLWLATSRFSSMDRGIHFSDGTD